MNYTYLFKKLIKLLLKCTLTTLFRAWYTNYKNRKKTINNNIFLNYTVKRGEFLLSNFCVTFPLKIELYQEYVLEKRFELARKLYNATLSKVYKRYNEMIKTKLYRNTKQSIENVKALKLDAESKEEQLKILYKQLNGIYLQYGLDRNSLQSDIKPMHMKILLKFYLVVNLGCGLLWNMLNQ